MADQEPQETSQETNGRAPASAPGVGEAAQLPERIRVHALAKLLGTTSKRILAHLTDMGSEARSAQSSLDRTVAESVREAFVPAEPAEAAAAQTTPAETAPAEPVEQSAPEPVTIAAPEAAVAEQAAEESAPDKPAEPAEPRRQSLFTSPFQSHQPQTVEPVTFEPPAVVAAPLFLSPDAAAAEEARRQRRAARQAKAEQERAEERTAEEPVVTGSTAQDKPARAESARGSEAVAAESDDSAETEDAAATGDWDDDQSHDDTDDGGRSRRRRRGRRGRGRGRGEQSADNDGDENDESDEIDEPAESAEDSADTEGEESASEGEAEPEGSTRRRRRRRRRKAGEDAESEPSDDDPPNTVVHEREPRNKRRASASVDEVQGISGSTRLEAKRQRRRDGREAGRRRPPILTESEFLARRESVDRVMVVREKDFTDHPSAVTQVAVLEDNILVEHFVTSTGSASMVGNVYLGRVQNVLPSMEAAFVDIGRGRNGVLYAGEVNWEAAGLGGKERKIEQALKPGDTVLVQVSKDPVGHKGARLTTQISLAGRFLVYVPGGTSTGISRKLPDTERKRLKEVLRDIVPQDAGVIIRTASEGVAEAELARDVERLQATWKTIEEQSKNGSGAPKTLYEEPDLLVKVIRDLFNEDFSKLVIEGERSWTTVENYIRTVAPDLLARVEQYDNQSVDVFGSFRIDEQLAKALDRKVWLPSGGTLVIDRTEAMTVIDVNTGKFTGAGGSNLEETVTRNNLEAAEEIVRQMRLRDIGGMIVVDFIDMVLESNRDLVLRRLTEALGRDRTRHQVSEVTSLGLVQMTRKKLGTGLVEAFSTTCEHCHGRGILVHDYPVESAPAEEGAGRREGRRRRKDKEKPAAPAPVVAIPAPVDAHAAEEEAAARRAHPVALAMAAHHGEDVEPHEVEAHGAQAAEAEAVESAAQPEAAEVSGAAAQAGEGVRTRRRRMRSGREAGREHAASESASTREPDGSATAASTPAESAPDRVAAGENGTAHREPAAAHADSGADTAQPHRDSDRSQAAPAHAATATSASAPVRRERRRVARTVAAPSTDNTAAVFVLNSSDQSQAPEVSLTDFEPPVVVPRSRPRRRGAGRAAGAPEQND
ncbi:ribonuclease E [Nocardia sp. GAS34]|uniref:translation initiation factor IF-2 N-terminal domain-containing protein n=1 Tax=unclassified Nocardia TaxID=2637762 RepID=UPI003D220ED6